VDIEIVLNIWAKKDEENRFHYPLLYHMLDTVAVCREIWNSSLQDATKVWISNQLNLDEEIACRQISFWVGLHDIGKAMPDFQERSQVVKKELETAGFKFCIGKHNVYHGTASACILQALFKGSLRPELAKKVAVALGGHHGTFPRSDELRETRLNLGAGLWDEVRSELFDHIARICHVQDVSSPAGNPENAFYMVLAGLTSVADWIASNEEHFSYEVQHDVEAHFDYAGAKALEALKKLGWTGWQPASSPIITINQLFPFITAIRPLQQESLNLSETITHQPGLVIIEAPMGEGKTEAAIYLTDSWMTNLKQRGCYFALPTMATSDQMFGRVANYINERYPGNLVNLMLLHGHAALSAEFDTLKEKFETKNMNPDSKDPTYDGVSPAVVASEWFTYRKRGLLAPFGVGTIDQALLAVLQTRHVFVRLFGLAHKTVIIDEIHAYDAYMTTLLERLLEWLAAMGSSVVLLSATLPGQRKDSLLQAYYRGAYGRLPDIPGEVSTTAYPRISWTSGESFGARSIETSDDSKKELLLRWVNGRLPEDEAVFELGPELQAALAEGGCAAVICNTVDRAQKVYQALKPYFPEADAGDGYPELDLLHARYLYGERKQREERTLLRFGKPAAKVACDSGEVKEVKRPARAVLVATQIIEQSLDLDFDLMVTDMAPADLLLQRAGRLHRHHKTADGLDRTRPEKLNKPALWVCQPEVRAGVPDFGGGTEAVYDYHILLRSWLSLNDVSGRKQISIPGDIEYLIEEVYGDSQCPDDIPEELRGKWEESKGELEKEKRNEITEAQDRWIKWPGYRQELWHICAESREEENPDVHLAHQALTRLAGLSVNVLCLHKYNAQLFLDSNLSNPLDTLTRPRKESVKDIMMHVVSISRRGLVEKIIQSGQKVPQPWREEPLLRHHYIMEFDMDNRYECEGYSLILDSERGLLIEKL